MIHHINKKEGLKSYDLHRYRKTSDKIQHLFIIMILNKVNIQGTSVQLSSVALCDPMNRSTPGLLVHHHLTEFTQTHVHRVCDAIQPPHPQLSPSSPALNLSQHQSLFQ